MFDKKLYQSKRFVSTVFMILIAVLLWGISTADGLDPDQQATLLDMIPKLFGVMIALVLGYSATDIAAILRDAGELSRMLESILDLIDGSSDEQLKTTTRAITAPVRPAAAPTDRTQEAVPRS